MKVLTSALSVPNHDSEVQYEHLETTLVLAMGAVSVHGANLSGPLLLCSEKGFKFWHTCVGINILMSWLFLLDSLRPESAFSVDGFRTLAVWIHNTHCCIIQSPFKIIQHSAVLPLRL